MTERMTKEQSEAAFAEAVRVYDSGYCRYDAERPCILRWYWPGDEGEHPEIEVDFATWMFVRGITFGTGDAWLRREGSIKFPG